MDSDEEPDMISSNLPLLFMDGHPTTLEEMHTEKLEDFITFMVKCSLGHDTAKEINVPLWWPKNIPFTNPFRRVDGYRCANWRESLISLIIKCYKYHRMEEMLDFSVKLASLPRKQLRPLDNWNGTTSFYDKRTRKLLVTIRNELLTYDHRKYPLRNKYKHVETVILESETETYACQNCFEDFNSPDELKIHETKCVPTDPLNADSGSDVEIIEVENYESSKIESLNASKDNFLKLFNLSPINDSAKHYEEIIECSSRSMKTRSMTKDVNKRNLVSLMKCPNIPFSSTVGQILLQKSNKKLTQENIQERINRVEKFIKSSPVKSKSATLPKHIVTANASAFKKRDQSTRKYDFRRYRRGQIHYPTLSQRSRFLYQFYTRPVQVYLKNLTDDDVSLVETKLKFGVPLQEIIMSLKVTPPVTTPSSLQPPSTLAWPQSPITVDDDPEIIVISDTESDNSESDVELMNTASEIYDDDVEIIEVQPPPLRVHSSRGIHHSQDPLGDQNSLKHI